MSETTAEPQDGVAGDAPDSRPSPGTIIRRTRERAGMSLEDLAGQMKLARSTLDALERDDFEQLREPVYVRGYYRKCAKVLPISEQELIHAYEGMVRPKAPATPERIVLAGGVTSGTVRRSSGRPGIILALLTAAVLGFLAWNADRGGIQLPKLQRSAPVSIIPEPEPMGAPAAPAETPSLGEPEPATDAETGAATVEPTVSPGSASPARSGPATPSAPAARTPRPPEPAAAAAPAPGAAAAPAAGATAPAQPVEGQLVIAFSEPSWVRVEDSRNRTLVIGLIRAGERQVLSGDPPYTVFLGNAASAQVEFGGKAVDISRHIRENGTARFTLP